MAEPYGGRDSAEMEWDERYREMRPAKRRKCAREKGKPTGHLLLAIQVIVCAAVLAGALALRLAGGEWFQTVKEWYWSHLTNSVVAEEEWEGVQNRLWDLLPPLGDEAASSQGEEGASEPVSSAPVPSSAP